MTFLGSRLLEYLATHVTDGVGPNLPTVKLEGRLCLEQVPHVLRQEAVLGLPALVVDDDVAHHVLSLAESLGTDGAHVGLLLGGDTTL